MNGPTVYHYTISGFSEVTVYFEILGLCTAISFFSVKQRDFLTSPWQPVTLLPVLSV